MNAPTDFSVLCAALRTSSLIGVLVVSLFGAGSVCAQEEPPLQISTLRLRKLSLPNLLKELKNSNTAINAKRLDID